MEYECPDSFFLIRIHTVVPSAVAQIGVAVASRDRVFRLELTFSQFTPEQRSGRYSPASGGKGPDVHIKWRLTVPAAILDQEWRL